MMLTLGGDSALHGKSTKFASVKFAAQNGSVGWTERLRAVFGRRHKAAPALGGNAQGNWLFDEPSVAESRGNIDPEWLQDFEKKWQPNGSAVKSRDAASPKGSPSPKSAPPRKAPAGHHEEQGALFAQGLSKTFKKRQVIKDVSLTVRRGEAIGLLGPNGAGKTTLFYMITGLVKPDAGLIMLDDYDVTSLPMYRRARLGIGYLPQEPSIFRGLSVEDNIRAVLEITQPNKRKRAEELESLLEEFDIGRLRKLPAIALSGGERRRCEIARALAGHPSFMLLDEPFAGIDPIAIGDIRVLVLHLKRRGIGVLITDHNVRETLDLIDRAYIVHAGQILTEGTPDHIVEDADVRRLYLGERFRM